MSKQIPAQIECPQCHHKQNVVLFRSIWIEYKKNRNLIFKDKINRFICTNCQFEINTFYPFLCTNIKRGIAVWYEPNHDQEIDRDISGYRNLLDNADNKFKQKLLNYVSAPRIKDWEDFKEKIVEKEGTFRNRRYAYKNLSKAHFSVSILDSIFGKRIVFEMPDQNGNVQKKKVTRRWFSLMKKEGQISELDTVKVQIQTPY